MPRSQTITTPPPAAAGIGAPIQLPRRLYADGEPISRLSQSSYRTFVACPEAWWRRYILGEKQPATPAMFLGSSVDRALTAMYAAQLSGQQPEIGDVIKLYHDGLAAALEEHQDAVAWTKDDTLDATRALGERAVRLYLDQVKAFMGRPVAVQRESRVRLAPGCRWTIQGHLDLETERVDRIAIANSSGEVITKVAVDGNELPGALQQLHSDGREYTIHERAVSAVCDYKVKAKLISSPEADDDIQGTLYLAMREIERNPADEFCFAILRKPNTKDEMAAKVLPTIRDARRRRGVLARFALMAQTVCALYERFGPEATWPLADPNNWKCSHKWCAHFDGCPGGRGL